MDVKDILFKLCSAVQIGSHDNCSKLIEEALSPIAEVKRVDPMSVAATFKGESDYTIMLDAHIDQIGMVVTDIDDNGFVKVAAAGGIDARILPAKPVKILGTKTVGAVFCSVPPHLLKEEKVVTDITKLTLDTGLGQDAKKYISIGDFAVYADKPAELLSGRVTSPFLDNRAGCAALLLTADLIKNKKLPCNVTLLFSDQEELGCRKAGTASFGIRPDEAIAVDVTFATDPCVTAAHGGELGNGPMIGISPFLSNAVTKKLCRVADECSIKHQKEVMGGATSTNADVIGVTAEGIPCGLLSVPLRNMHTNVEVVSLNDIELTASLLEKYIMTGGAL